MYILVTPVKNEENNIHLVAESVINQSVRPFLWIIVDDGSTDNTAIIIKDLALKYNWIEILTLETGPRDQMFHYPHVCKSGFDHALKYTKINNINYNYIGLLDADTVLEKEYFGKLMKEFERDKRLGIASGGVYYSINGSLKWEKTRENLPRGTGRLWRKECFLNCGYLARPSADSISNIKAILRNWRVRQFKETIAVQRRRTSSAEGLWKGYKIKGYKAYYLNKHPLLVLLAAASIFSKWPFYQGLAYIYGYLNSVYMRDELIDDLEVRDYYKNKRLKEYTRFLRR